ncbi:MAG: hypothetical protein NC388_09445 [Clostridium sp.]|nr:hypothetical protein [Clostridium sp.]
MKIYHEKIAGVMEAAVREAHRRNEGLRVWDMACEAGLCSRSGYQKVKRGS